MIRTGRRNQPKEPDPPFPADRVGVAASSVSPSMRNQHHAVGDVGCGRVRVFCGPLRSLLGERNKRDIAIFVLRVFADRNVDAGIEHGELPQTARRPALL